MDTFPKFQINKELQAIIISYIRSHGFQIFKIKMTVLWKILNHSNHLTRDLFTIIQKLSGRIDIFDKWNSIR